nr:sigma-70 family RNA polymerase sigma factor [Anaerolineae bacterium]
MTDVSHSLDHLDDAELVRLAKTDQRAFGVIYERYIDRIYNYIYYRTGNKYDAEDLTSRVFQRAMRHISGYEDRGVPFSAWLYRIAHNLVVNYHRDRKRRQIVPIEDLVITAKSSEAPEFVTQQREEHEELLQAIRNLPEDRQQMLILKYIERMSNAEIGEIMGRSEGAIKSLYHRTLIALRAELNRIQKGQKRRSDVLKHLGFDRS